MRIKQSDQLPYLKSLFNCLNKIKTGGYTASFKAVTNGLFALQTNRTYQPAEIKVVNTFWFEGISDKRENAVMYIIETIDGLKGTLVKRPYSAYTDTGIESFMKAVKSARKKED